MRRTILALIAVALVTGCSSTGPQSVADLPHEDRRPVNAVRVSAGDVAAESRCYGDGQSGKRVQAVYVTGGQDRYATVAPKIAATWAANVDGALNDSAAKRGGTAHVRWACSGGVIDVIKVTAPVGDIYATRSALQAAGLSRSDRKYVAWVDDTRYCGIAFTVGTSTAETTAGYARIDSGCWGFGSPVELHELVHTLGGVPLASPDSDGAWHCRTGADRECTNETIMKCPPQDERLLDCGNDSYADWGTPANPMPYNIALSGFFESTFGGATPDPTVTPSPSPTATSPSPTPTATATPSPSVTSTPTVSPTASPSPTATKGCGKSQRPGCR